MNGSSLVARWIRTHLEQHPPRTKSLIVTIFGDSIEPHGGTIWMASLVRLLRPFGVLERNVRTSVFRLAQENWLETAGERVGKRSHYRMTAAGRMRAAHAHRRIYGEPAHSWSGTWTLLLLEQGASPALRRDLLWQGFGRFSPQVYAHPAPDAQTLQEILSTHGTDNSIAGFQARAMDVSATRAPVELVERGWALGELAGQYGQFLTQFETLAKMLAKADVSDEQYFVLRSLLIHAFRRTQLRDPHLPASLLPASWPGASARELCKLIYGACSAGAERYLVATAESPDGPLRPPAPYFFERFGGMAAEGSTRLPT